MPLAAYGVTHQGRRSTNEDAWLVDLDLGLLVVADGMGGHNAGEVASALAVKRHPRSRLRGGDPPSQALLTDAVAACQRADPRGRGRATRALRDGHDGRRGARHRRACVLHQRRRQPRVPLAQRSPDAADAATTRGWRRHWRAEADTTARHRFASDASCADEGGRAQTGAATVGGECPLGAGDALLLCSDGVHGAVPHELLATMLSSKRASKTSPRAWCDPRLPAERPTTSRLSSLASGARVRFIW